MDSIEPEEEPQSIVLDEDCRALEDYDPMKQDFFNAEFNSYDGVELAPGIMRDETYAISKAVIRLFVDRIPYSLDENGLRNLFSMYGTVLECRIFRRTNQDTRRGYVSYGSRSEATKAIDEIHESVPLFLRVFFHKNYQDDSPSEDDLVKEEIRIKQEKLLAEFDENRGIHWEDVPPLPEEGPCHRLQSLLLKEEELSSFSWVDPIFRDNEPSLPSSLSSGCVFERQTDYLKAQSRVKTTSGHYTNEVIDEIYEIGKFFGDPIPFHKISDHIKKRNIIPEPNSDVPTKDLIPSMNLPHGQSSEVFIRIFSNGSELDMFAIKDPSVYKWIRRNLNNAFEGSVPRSGGHSGGGDLLAIKLKRDCYWYRSYKTGDRFFLFDFGKYVCSEDVEVSRTLPEGFREEIPAQAIPAIFYDDIKLSSDNRVLINLLLLFKNKKIRVQPMGLHRNGQVLLRFEGAKAPNGRDLLDYLLEEGYAHKVSPPLQLGVDYDLYEDNNQLIGPSQHEILLPDTVVFILDFMESTNEVCLLKVKAQEERNAFNEKLQGNKEQMTPLDPSFVTENRIILYHCSKDQTLYRGKITAYDSRKKKARLFLIDFGHICIASFSKLYAMDKDLISVPPFAIVATLKDVERFFLFNSEVFLKTRRLLPLLRAPLTVISVTNSSSNLVLRHPSGKSINTIIQDKIFLHEPDNCRNIEGQGRFNVFDYNHCLISELCSKASYPSSSSLEAIILHIQSPKEIFATPLHSLPLYADTLRQIRAFVSINSKEPTHHRPDRNKLCLVKSSADGAWYRGVALDKRLNIFLADFGMIENEVSPSDIQVMNPKLMESPLLANHCIYKGFEGLQLEIDEEDMSFLKNLAYTKISIRVLEVRDCSYVIEIPSIHEKMMALREKVISKELT